MPRITKVYTRTGDDGTTALGSGRRISKNSARIRVCGSVDELNAQLGVALAAGLPHELAEPLRTIQNELFHAGAELSIPQADRAQHSGPQIEARHVAALEQLIDRFSAQLPPLPNFVLPGGCPAAAALHVARTVCRRAECDGVALAEHEPVGEPVRTYLNRLSDALFVLARSANQRAGIAEPLWESRA